MQSLADLLCNPVEQQQQKKNVRHYFSAMPYDMWMWDFIAVFCNGDERKSHQCEQKKNGKNAADK